jgi:hypothetical protein
MSRSSVNVGSGPCCDQAAITSYPGSTPAQRHLTNLQCLTLRQWARATEIIDSMLFVLPTTRVSVGGTPRRTGQSPRLKILLAYISWYINDYGRPWTSPDVNPRIRPNPGQIAGTGGVLLTTTEQKASSPFLSDRRAIVNPLRVVITIIHRRHCARRHD